MEYTRLRGIIFLFGFLFAIQLSYSSVYQTEHYRQNYLINETIHVHKNFSLDLTVLFNTSNDGVIEIDSIIPSLTGVILGLSIEKIGDHLSWQDMNTGEVNWSVNLHIKFLTSGDSAFFSESFTVRGLLSLDKVGANTEIVNTFGEVPKLSGTFTALYSVFSTHILLMFCCFLFLSFHRNINRLWLFIVLFITPVIGPGIYILNRITKAIKFIRNKITTSKAIEAH